MNRYAQLFSRLDDANQGAFVPFVMLGDPTPELSLSIVDALVEGGADALELGIPFSDPVADGPTIQGAALRAFASHTTPDDCFELLGRIRAKYPQLPIGLLVYANLVYVRKIDGFYEKCQQAGVDSVLVADVPVQMCAPYKAAADKFGIDSIFIAPPNGDAETLKQVAELGNGYTYLVSRAGVTGAETKAGMPVEGLLNTLREFNAPPALLGFGISEPAQVREAIAAGAAGAISGSAVVKIIETHHQNPEHMLTRLKEFVEGMKAATNR
ncbi:tryptophan synthase subunit alpha [Aeromonas veronii]|uniref:tryptophan synthase subunit alpha n=1 Tax=Aeromonas veronii TaxID=654 RepID=UPI001F18674B|nr:tryptophan synthase subunit alpha [Aeromonas veronii]MCF5862032.1 tryptophan synthase subunit alpha [Aeromonas veronii]